MLQISPSLRHLDCRVPSVTLVRGAATRDARNARDLGVASSPQPRAGEARAGAPEGTPGDPPAAFAGSTAPTTEHVARTPVELPRARSSPEPRRGQSGFSEISRKRDRYATRDTVSFSTSFSTVALTASFFDASRALHETTTAP